MNIKITYYNYFIYLRTKYDKNSENSYRNSEYEKCYISEKYKHTSAEWAARIDSWMVFIAQSMQQLKRAKKPTECGIIKRRKSAKNYNKFP